MRDASGRVPVNFITVPGVHLTKACFPEGIYDDVPTQTCISDLLASQFRRLVIDLYWDNINRQFNLCPVELPPLAGNATVGYSVDVSALSSITATTLSATVVPTDTPTAAARDGPSLKRRQSSVSNSTSPTPSFTTGNPSTTSTSAGAIPTSTGASGTTLLELGPYVCSLDLNLDSIISLYNDYFEATSDTVHARLHYLIINLHAAAPFTEPSAPAHTPMQGRLPGIGDLLGAQFQNALPRALFTPAHLEEDRQDLNKSWFHDNYRLLTDTHYFHTTADVNGVVSTQDGWPGETWILLTDSRRLLLSWGEVDPQMKEYDFVGDSSIVFAAEELASPLPTELNSAGDLVPACFYKQGEATVAGTNSSWALATFNQMNSSALPAFAQNTTGCGISPILNLTLGNSAAQDHLALYQEFVQSSIFGWAPGEPLNISTSNNKGRKGSAHKYRCAVLDASNGYRGHWRVEQCEKEHRAACRIGGQPYAWRLSETSVPFDSAPSACQDETEFDLPRTGLENTYLYRHILNDTTHRDDDSDSILTGVWINFNSLDKPDCWVTSGPNATCSYSDYEEEERQREVLIPAIAAVIVLILTVLTLLVKCNKNRRNNRSRRRGGDGWEYEGVPS